MATTVDVFRAKRRAIGGKRPRCGKGKSCSAACINNLKQCLVDMPSAISKSLSRSAGGIRSLRYKDRVQYAKLKLKKIGRGKKYKEAKKTIIENMAYMAKLGRKGSYDAWEKKLLGLQSKAGGKWRDSNIVKKGEIWKDNYTIREKGRLKRWDKAYKGLISKMEVASKEGNRGAYLRLEKGLIKLLNKAPEGSLTNPIPREIVKGFIWASGQSQRQNDRAKRISASTDKIRLRMRKEAEDGDRKNYLKSQRKLFLLDKEYYRLKGGIAPVRNESIWKQGRAEVSEMRFKEALLRAVGRGDRGAFNRLIERHSKVSKGYDKGMWDDYRKMALVIDRLKKSNLIKDSKYNTSLKHNFSKGILGEYSQVISVVSKVLGNKLEIEIKPNSFNFTVNDSLMAKGLPKREALAIGREVKRQFAEIIKNLNEGMVVGITAARGEDKIVESRKRAYVRVGFYNPMSDSHDSLFGIVRGGKIKPIREKEFLENQKNRF